MKKRTRSLQFDTKTKKEIIERDNSCLFCRIGYHLSLNADTNIFDIMHIVPKSQGGMGIKENGVLGCRYHHSMLDNGNQGLRPEMLLIIEEYMESIYPDWRKEKLVYQKYSSFG